MINDLKDRQIYIYKSVINFVFVIVFANNICLTNNNHIELAIYVTRIGSILSNE